MSLRNLYQRRPPGASCGWVQQELANGPTYRWWKNGAECLPGYMRIYGGVAVNNRGVNVVPPSASWWTGGNAGGYYGSGLNCFSGTNGYLLYHDALRVDIDVMQALRDGIWTSSVSFTVYASYVSTVSDSIRAFVINSAAFRKPDVSGPTKTIGTVAGCGLGTVFTVTVYDDGRITVS